MPEPVGAATRVERPLRMCGQAAVWASVGAGNVFRNQPATAGWKSSSALGEKGAEAGADAQEDAEVEAEVEAQAEAGREAASEAAGNAGSKPEESEGAPNAAADVEAEVMLA